MKKLLTLLTSLGVVTNTGFLTVSCFNKPDDGVVETPKEKLTEELAVQYFENLTLSYTGPSVISDGTEITSSTDEKKNKYIYW